MGPTVHIRILTLLAQSGVLQEISQTTQLPEGVDSQSILSQVKEIAGPDAICYSLIRAQQRVTVRCETENKCLKMDGQMHHAYVACYMGITELAASLFESDKAAEGMCEQHLGGVMRELVLCSGNGAEMAFGLGRFERAMRMYGGGGG